MSTSSKGAIHAWGNKSNSRLSTCHPLLIELFNRVIKRDDLPCDLTIVCGHRDEAAQKAAFEGGFSKVKWPNSKHNQQPSMAVDWAPLDPETGRLDWSRADLWEAVGPLIEEEWKRMDPAQTNGWALSWGGRWARFRDLPHVELRGTPGD